MFRHVMIRTFFALILAGCATAMSASALGFTNLYAFSPDGFNNGSPDVSTNSDGINPAGFLVDGDVIYGTTSNGGANGGGTIFRINRDGTGFKKLFDFKYGTFNSATGTYVGSTGTSPMAGLLLISNALYGTTFYGGVHGLGAVFKIDTTGSNYSVIASFAATNGQSPSSGLTLYSNALYGTTTGGGSNANGTVFAVNLSDLSLNSYYQFPNAAQPYGNLVVVSNNLYGFTRLGGGPSSDGFVFRVGPAGFADLYDFSGDDGARPYAGPVASGKTLYGVTFEGGTNGSGNIFRIDVDGHNFTNLYSFSSSGGGNLDGVQPVDLNGILVSGNTLYGTATLGGSGSQGTVFKINTDGSGFTVLHSFSRTDGSQPDPLILDGSTLFGMTTYGIQGSSLGNGGIFAIIMPPTLFITPNGTNVVLNWNDPSFSLYSSPVVNGAYTKILGATSPYTNGVSGAQRFFRLQ